MAWSTSGGKRYLLPEDSCYERYRAFLKSDEVHFYTSASEAERAGFVRKPVALVPLKKYADVCSPLYEYALAAACEKVFLDKGHVDSFVPIEQFKSDLAEIRVVGIVRSKTYLTPCDTDYKCLMSPAESRSPECRQSAESTGQVRVFASEREARDASYVSVAESYFNELGEKF